MEINLLPLALPQGGYVPWRQFDFHRTEVRDHHENGAPYGALVSAANSSWFAHPSRFATFVVPSRADGEGPLIFVKISKSPNGAVVRDLVRAKTVHAREVLRRAQDDKICGERSGPR